MLLLSHPRLGDYFHRKVILLCDHDESGARGLVLNAPTRMRAGTLAAAHGKRGRIDQAWLAKGPGGASRVRRASLIAMTRAAERLTQAFAAANAAAAAAAAAESRSRAPPASSSAASSSAEWSEADGFEENDDDFDSFDEGDVSDDEAATDRSRGIIIEARVPLGGDLSDEEDDESIFDDLDSESDDDEDAPAGEAASFALLAKEAGPTLLRKCWRHGVYSGGPVAGGAVLHACADVGATRLLGGEGEGSAAGGVYLGGDLSRLAAQLGGERSRRKAVRLFAGEATWHGGQLEAELARGEWLLASAAPDWVLGGAAHAPGDCMWQRAMRALGGEHAEMAALPSRVGRDEAPPPHPFSVRFHLLP